VKGTPESGKIRLVESRKIAKEKSEDSDAMRTLLRPAQGDIRNMVGENVNIETSLGEVLSALAAELAGKRE
jgi:hypothetical protein